MQYYCFSPTSANIRSVWTKKKEQRLAPTFVNLKSNTMKNTVQRYGFLANLQIFWMEKYVS